MVLLISFPLSVVFFLTKRLALWFRKRCLQSIVYFSDFKYSKNNLFWFGYRAFIDFNILIMGLFGVWLLTMHWRWYLHKYICIWIVKSLNTETIDMMIPVYCFEWQHVNATSLPVIGYLFCQWIANILYCIFIEIYHSATHFDI